MKGDFIVGTLLGLAAGAVLGVLYAPDKGEITREKLRKATEEGCEDFKEGSKEFSHGLHVRGRYIRKEMHRIKNILAQHGEDLKEEARQKLLSQLEKLEKALAKEEENLEKPQLEA